MNKKTYIAIDLKSFYASVECVEMGLDPMDTYLVVADSERTEKTICLAVSPSLKTYGISGRARLFEVVSKIREVNTERKRGLLSHNFSGASHFDSEIKKDPNLEVSYIVAPPRMAYYMKYSGEIYNIYLKYFSPDDIHVYSIDEVFIDVTGYLNLYNMTARELTSAVINDIYKSMGITATAGIGTNLYLCKVAMDIVAKKMPPDKNGARIAVLDEMSYKKTLWNHTPLTDFWRVGSGYEKKLVSNGIYTMGDIAKCSVGGENDYYNEELLYKLFGVNAELLIDHAWGYEPCTISDIKAYRPQNRSLSSGQVLHCPYDFKSARLVTREMADSLSLELVDKNLVANSVTLTVEYDVSNLKGNFKGKITEDRYGRKIPKHAHKTKNIGKYTSSSKLITNAFMSLYDEVVNKKLLVRKITVTAENITDYTETMKNETYEQFDMFTDYNVADKIKKESEESLMREREVQKAVIRIKKKYGKNSVVKGMNLEDGATGMSRNRQIGGHKA